MLSTSQANAHHSCQLSHMESLAPTSQEPSLQDQALSLLPCSSSHPALHLCPMQPPWKLYLVLLGGYEVCVARPGMWDHIRHIAFLMAPWANLLLPRVLPPPVATCSQGTNLVSFLLGSTMVAPEPLLHPSSIYSLCAVEPAAVLSVHTVATAGETLVQTI